MAALQFQKKVFDGPLRDKRTRNGTYETAYIKELKSYI